MMEKIKLAWTLLQLGILIVAVSVMKAEPQKEDPYDR